MREREKYTLADRTTEFLEQCQQLHGRVKEDWCLVVIDIQYFMLFNEVYGREEGDHVLAEILRILRNLEVAHNCVTTYRGQDDFALFMGYDRVRLEWLFREMHSVIAANKDTLGFLPAFGVYILEEDEVPDLNLLDHALAALDKAKRNPIRDRICVYDSDTRIARQKEYEILLRLKDAISRGEVTFYLQPQCRISTRKVVGAEALARWITAEGKMISPMEFIPVLEKHGLIGDFDRVIWESVCKWIRSVMDRGIAPVPISVNISRIDMLSMNVVEYLEQLCERYHIPTYLLKVEITESAYADEEVCVPEVVRAFREKGFLTMMDDFGAGYSSLNTLENVSVDVLKLDMLFIKEKNLHSRKGVTIIESIINMSKMMKLPIVVEGVETEEQVQFLKGLGCRYAQGYYFYRPMPQSEFIACIADEINVDRRGFISKMNEQFHVREFLDENTFTDTMLNNVLGPVAFYTLDQKDLTITRFNQQFYQAIGDASMESRQVAIQHYVVKEDWPALYRALDDAYREIGTGGTCEIRFYKSDDSVFWFRMHFFYLKQDGTKRIYYGQVEDVTQERTQIMYFLDTLRKQAVVSMVLNLDRNKIQYVVGENSLYQVGLPSMELKDSIEQTIRYRIDDSEDKEAFRAFFDKSRIVMQHRKAIYHETLRVKFRLLAGVEAVKFSTYYIRHGCDQDLMVYSFARPVGAGSDQQQEGA